VIISAAGIFSSEFVSDELSFPFPRNPVPYPIPAPPPRRSKIAAPATTAPPPPDFFFGIFSL
jgi:hypothetical protein